MNKLNFYPTSIPNTVVLYFDEIVLDNANDNGYHLSNNKKHLIFKNKQ